jgi:hypothetical protein
MPTRRSIETLCGLTKRDFWLASPRPHYFDLELDLALARKSTALDLMRAELAARAERRRRHGL